MVTKMTAQHDDDDDDDRWSSNVRTSPLPRKQSREILAEKDSKKEEKNFPDIIY